MDDARGRIVYTPDVVPADVARAWFDERRWCRGVGGAGPLGAGDRGGRARPYVSSVGLEDFMRLMVTGSRTTLRVIVALALAQAVLGVLRALHWFQIGVDLSQSGLLLLPILGVVTLARGALVGTLALLYGLFSWAALTGKSWARPVGLLACGLNILAVLGLLRIIDSWAAVLFWLIAPVIVGAYLLRSDVPPPLRTTGRS